MASLHSIVLPPATLGAVAIAYVVCLHVVWRALAPLLYREHVARQKRRADAAGEDARIVPPMPVPPMPVSPMPVPIPGAPRAGTGRQKHNDRS